MHREIPLVLELPYLCAWHCLGIHLILLDGLAAFGESTPQNTPHNTLARAGGTNKNYSHTLL